jgi:hypothetical protein
MAKEKKTKQIKAKDQPNPNHKEDFLKILIRAVQPVKK